MQSHLLCHLICPLSSPLSFSFIYSLPHLCLFFLYSLFVWLVILITSLTEFSNCLFKFLFLLSSAHMTFLHFVTFSSVLLGIGLFLFFLLIICLPFHHQIYYHILFFFPILKECEEKLITMVFQMKFDFFFTFNIEDLRFRS